MVLELKRLLTLGTLELPQEGAFVVTDHVALQSVYIGERLVTQLT